MYKIPEKYRPYFIYLALTVITLAVFFQVRNFEFVNYDDNRYVTENRHVITGLTLGNILWAFASSHFFMWHPVTSLSHMIDCELFGLNPAWHHLTNLLIHIINALLLFEILRRMTNRLWPSAFVAAIFALHPLNVESVAWVAERKNLLSGFFWLLTIAAYIRYAKHPRTLNYVLLIFVFALALMAKPTTVTLPFVLLLLDYWPLDRFEKLPLRQLVKEKIPLFVLSAGLCVITIVTQQSGDVLSLNRQLPFLVRLANALVSYVTYIAKMIYPVHLAVFYPHPENTLPLSKPIIAFVLLVAVSIVLLYFGRRKLYLTVGWLWFLGALVPVIGLVQAGEQAMADRYAYIPLVGLFIIVAWGASDLLGNWKYRKVLLAVLSAVVVLVLSVCTWLQTSCWRNSRILFEHALAVNENNYVAHYCLGEWWFQQGKNGEAVARFHEALRINPNYLLAHTGLGAALAKQGKFDEAIERFRYVIKYDPESDETYYNLGVALAAQGKYDDALQQYRKAVELNPDYVTVYNNTGAILFFQGKLDEAVDCYQKALKLEPDYADAHNNLGAALSAQGKLNEAIDQFRKALQLKPDAPNTHCNLGYALSRQGKSDEGIAHISEALRLNPNFAEAYYYLALVLAQKGRIDEAVKDAERALELAQAVGNTQLANQIRKSLDSYKSRQK